MKHKLRYVIISMLERQNTDVKMGVILLIYLKYVKQIQHSLL